jgi:hypothetical protein
MEQILHEIINTPQKMRETYIKKNYPKLYDSIINWIELDISFKEKLWYFYTKKKSEVLCKCGEPTSFNKNFKDGYKKYCSSKCVQKDEETKRKRKNTLLEKYNVDNIAKLDSVKEKTKETNLKKYGHVSTFQSEKVREKWKKSIKEKYGVDHVFQLDSVKEKIKDTMNDKYGDHYTKTEYYKDKLDEIGFSTIIKKKKLEKHKKFFQENGYEFLEIKDYRLFKLKKGDDIFEIYWDTFINRLENGYEISTNKNPLYYTGKSNSEMELLDWLKSVYKDNIKTSDRSILEGKELDIYLSDIKVAIEFNGIYWHSELNKNKDHHYSKTVSCENNGIHLIHVWEDDWQYKKEIIKSIILNKIGNIKNKIYARNCIIKEVSSKNAEQFLNKNHIQGMAKSSIRYGLYYNEELVSLMTFGYRYINSEKKYELIRFCNKVNTNIPGSGSKLFKHFLNNNKEHKNIISYSDRSIFDGNLYEKLGFKNDGETKLNYWWVLDKKRFHRFTFNKKRLMKEGYDPHMTEKEIMYKRGAYRIWGCGQIRWVYQSSKISFK